MSTPLLPPPPWYASERRAGATQLHHLVARLGRTPASLTLYRHGDGLRSLAAAEAAGVPLRQTAITLAVARTYEGAWRVRVACPSCGAQHVHGAGAGVMPVFGPRAPPCAGGATYYLRFDSTDRP